MRGPIDTCAARANYIPRSGIHTLNRYVRERAKAVRFEIPVMVEAAIERFERLDEIRAGSFAVAACASYPCPVLDGTSINQVGVSFDKLERLLRRIELMPAVVSQRDIQRNLRANGPVDSPRVSLYRTEDL